MTDMNNKTPKIRKSKFSNYLSDLLAIIDDPFYVRILESFIDSDPIKSMEDEVGNVLMEILENED